MGRRTAVGALVLVAALLPGCSEIWTSDGAPRPLTGAPVDFNSAVKLNRTPSGTVNVIRGEDGNPWAAFCEVWNQGLFGRNAGCTGMRLSRLSGDPVEEFVEADRIALRGTAVYLLADRPQVQSTQLHIHRAGRAEDRVFLFPKGEALLLINDRGRDDTFVYWVKDKATTTFSVRRENGGGIDLPVPEGVDPATLANGALFLSANGDILVVRDGKGRVTGYTTSQPAPSWSLGTRKGTLGVDLPHATLLSLEEDGLHAVTFDGQHEVNLTPMGKDDPPWDPTDPQPAAGPLVPDFLQYSLREAFLQRGLPGAAELYRVPLDGSALPRRVADRANRVIALPPGYLGGDRRLVTTRDPSTVYAGGAGDLWVDGFRAGERARGAGFSASGKRLLFLEHAAHAGTYGELTLVDLPDGARPGGTPVVLGDNVRQWSELGDGRILAVENHVQVGAWNRLVAIDPDAPGGPAATWVSRATHEYALINGGKEIIADVVSGASGYDLYRFPVPPR